MPATKMHSLLTRQLKRFFGDSFTLPDEWSGFIEAVNSAYHESDTDRNMLERSLELSSMELLQANSEMRAIFEVVPDIFFRIDLAGTILDCKTGNISDLLMPRRDLIGHKIYDIPLASVADKFRQAMEEIKQTSAAASFEYSLPLPEAENFYEARLIPLLEDQAIVIIRNVTDRKNAENALKASEEYYREITMNSSDVLFIVDARGIITYASPSIERITGFSPEEVTGKSSLFLIASDDHARAGEDFRKALKTRDLTIPNSFRIRHKNGGEIMMEGVGKNLLHHPAIAGFVMNIRDVTDRQKAEVALRESEKKYRLLTEKMSDVVWIADMNLRTVYVTPSVKSVLGFTREERMNQTVDQQFTPESLSLGMEAMVRELALEEKGDADPQRSATLVLEYYHKDGSTRWMETVMTGLRDEQGKLIGLHGVSRDITERKQAQDALEKSEQKYRQLAEMAHDLIVTVDLDFKITYANQAVIPYSGGADVIGMNLLEFTPPHLHPAQKEIMQKRSEGFSDMLAFEWEIFHHEGKSTIFDIRSSLITDDGKPSGVLFIARDSTERRRAEKALRESEKKYRLLTEKMTDAVWTTDLNFKTTYVTPSINTLLGFSQEERMLQDVTQQLTPASLSHIYNVYTEERALEEKGQQNPDRSRTLVLEYYHKDGSTRWMETTISGLRNHQGDVIGFHGINRDVTERKKAEESLQASEERYRAIFESTATANLILGEDKTILMANNNFAELSGYTQQEIEGKLSWTRFVHPDDLETMKDYHQKRRIHPAAAPSSYEFRFINRKGEIRELFISVAVIPGTQESIVSMVDFTEMKQLETQLLQAQKMESVGRLAGGVAHDFNNMLSVIIGNAEMAMKKVKRSDPLYQTLQDVLSAGMRSADLTRQLLAFARKQTVSPKVLDLNDTITGMLKMLQRLIGENIDLGWHPGHNLWQVKIDPSQVDQLLANLAVNGRDAIGKSGRITIETFNITCDEAYCTDRPECIPGDYVMLAVSDNGSGMKKETLANIFEPFFTTKPDGQGTGLGLATVYGIVKQNNGFINVYSEPERGTTFRIYLPRFAKEITEPADDAPERPLRGGTETILIIEDEETVLKLSQTMLEALGYQVLAARNKDQALQAVEEYKGKINLLLVDVVMPDMNGKELSENILAVRPDLKCLFMSGYTADVIARQGILEEGIQFISKPFSLQDLADKVREVLEGQPSFLWDGESGNSQIPAGLASQQKGRPPIRRPPFDDGGEKSG